MPSVSPPARANIPKMRLASSGATPGPLSSTVTIHSCEPRGAETTIRGGASPRNLSALATRF